MKTLKAIQSALKLTYNDSEEEKEYRRLKLPLNKEYHKVTSSLYTTSLS